jgi:hypothetical protein
MELVRSLQPVWATLHTSRKLHDAAVSLRHVDTGIVRMS